MSARGVLRIVQGGGLMFWCPGCKEMHLVHHGSGPGPRWTFNGDYEKPTFSPSVLVRSGHYIPGAPRRPDGKCSWCEEAEKDGEPSMCSVCHSYVRGGKIQFLSDCTHELAGQTVNLLPRPEVQS